MIAPDLDFHDDSFMATTLMALWSLEPPMRFGPFATGVNNRSWLVSTASGQFVLKNYRDVTDPDCLAFEHALLAALDGAGLPFAVPAPIPAASGATLVEVGDERWSLFRHIPGRAAERDSELDARRAGEALATLHLALAAVTLDPAIPIPGTFGDLASVHPAVPDPAGAIDGLLGAEVARVATEAVARWRQETAGWPAQVIHTDVYPANVLLAADAVSGVLDFEYAGRGHRAMDVAIGLGAFCAKTWDDGWSWPVYRAFAGGYLRRWSLDGAELDAIPTLMLVREATSLVHWLGRHARGLTDRADIEERGRQLLAMDRWLDGNRNRLIQELRVVRDA